MPRVLSHGRVVSGVGVVPLNDTTAIGQRGSDADGWRVCTWPFDAPDAVTPVAANGCSVIAASDGFWLADLLAPGKGVFGADGVFHPDRRLVANLNDGRGFGGGGIIAVSTPDGIGLELVGANGPPLQLPNAVVDGSKGVAVVGPTEVAWVDPRDGQLKSHGLGTLRTLPSAYLGLPQVFVIDGERWLSYFASDALGIVLHPAESFDGYQVAPVPAFSLHGAVLHRSRTIRFAWSLTPSETDVRTRDLSLTEPRRDLRALQPGPPPFPSEPPKEPPVPPDHSDVPDLSAVLDTVRRKYGPVITFDECVAVLNETAYGRGFKLFKKSGGNRGKQPRTGIECSTDILGWPIPGGMLYADVLGSTDGGPGVPGPAVPQWPRGAWDRSADADVPHYIDPVPPLSTDIPVPRPDPPPLPPPADDLSKRVAALEGMASTLDARLRHLEGQPASGIDEGRVVALIDAALAHLWVEGRTGNAGGGIFGGSHSHPVSHKVVRKP